MTQGQPPDNSSIGPIFSCNFGLGPRESGVRCSDLQDRSHGHTLRVGNLPQPLAVGRRQALGEEKYHRDRDAQRLEAG